MHQTKQVSKRSSLLEEHHAAAAAPAAQHHQHAHAGAEKPTTNKGIVMRDATFAYSTTAAATTAASNTGAAGGDGGGVKLLNCTLSVAPGEVVAVVGSLGSGKSSLIRALLGEMTLVGEEEVVEGAGDGSMEQQAHGVGAGAVGAKGEARVSGSVAYVPQTAWVPNESFRCVC